MKRILLAMLICGSSFAAWPQSGQGYLFYAPGQFRAAGESLFGMNFGGGGKYIARNGLGIGGELGILAPKENFSDLFAGLTSVNGYYAFKSKSKTEPFVTGGYSRTFGHGSGMNWGNFGGGITYWAGNRTGLLLEFREHLSVQEGISCQFWSVRIGVAFRGER
jgi:hypothetical protein